MARKSEGWRLYLDDRTGNWIVRFRHAGQRVKRSTRQTDFGKAQEKAAEIYAEVREEGQRRGRAPLKKSGPKKTLPLVLAEWLADLEHEVAPDTFEAFENKYVGHFLAFFRSVDDITDELAWDEYIRQRLRVVKRRTVQKEVSAGRRLLRWLKRERMIARLPTLEMPSGPGTEYKGGKYRQVRVDLTEDQCEAILAALPERSRRKHPARAFYTVMWELGLRRGSLTRLRASDVDLPTRTLRLRDEADKSRFGRELHLTDRAVEALESVMPEVGLVFGPMDLRETLQLAAQAAGIRNWKHVSNHDFRHGRLTHLAGETTDVQSLRHLAGHKHLATTSLYIHPRKEGVRRLLEGTNDTRKKKRKKR